MRMRIPLCSRQVKIANKRENNHLPRDVVEMRYGLGKRRLIVESSKVQMHG